MKMEKMAILTVQEDREQGDREQEDIVQEGT